MNTRWKSLFLAVFSACLLAGSVNARVCFLADGKCNDMQLRPVAVGDDCKFNKTKENCTEPKEPGGEKCRKNDGTFYYEKCVCPTAYKYEEYTSDEVYDYTSGDVSPQMRTCDGKTMYKVCKAKYQYVEDADNVNNRFESLGRNIGSNIYHSVKNCSDGSSVDEYSDSCEEIGLGIKRYSGCGCDVTKYPYTEEMIKGHESLVSLDGDTCVVNGVIHYENLRCTGGSRNGFFYRDDCADNETLISDQSLRDVNDNIICYACKAPKTCEELGMFNDVTTCQQSGYHVGCVLDDATQCYKVQGCETTSLGYQQTLVDHYNCYDDSKVNCSQGMEGCYKECACIQGEVDGKPQDCNVSYNNQGTVTQPICELDCASLGYKQCDKQQHWVATDAYDYCIGDITQDNPYRSDNYYRECERKNQCYPLSKDDPRYYWDGSGVGYCEMVLEIEEDDKWNTEGNPSPDGYWKGESYSENRAEYWLNNGYYHADRCVPWRGTDDVDETDRHLRLHHCESEDRDCAGNLPPRYSDDGSPGWKTANVDNNCLNPAPEEYDIRSEEKDENGLLLHDGIRVECGGRDYIKDCECTYDKYHTFGRCNVVAIPENAEAGHMFYTRLKGANWSAKQIVTFTGEYYQGCDDGKGNKKFKIAYGYVNNENLVKCLSKDPIDAATDVCTIGGANQTICDGEIVSTWELDDNITKVRCNGTCVQTKECTADQACETAVTIGDEQYCTKCVTPKTCSYREDCVPKATDARTGAPYCPEKSSCTSVCEIYAKNLIAAGKAVTYLSEGNCDITPRGRGYETHNAVVINGDDCLLHQNCFSEVDENSPCKDVFTKHVPIPSGLTHCSTKYCHENAQSCETCHEEEKYSDKCCLEANSGDIFKRGDQITDFNSMLDRGFTNVTKEYFADGSSNCLYARCQEGRTKIDNGSTISCCPNAKEGHKVVSGVNSWDVDVTNDYKEEYGNIPEGCYYVERQVVSCEDYIRITKKDNQCSIFFDEGKADTDNYYYVFGPYSSNSYGGVIAYNCYKYNKCSVDDCDGKISPIKGAKTAEELCGEGKVPDSSGLIPECGGKYYKADTQCVCPAKEGYYQNQTEGSEYYSVGNLDIEGCEYYAKCNSYSPPDGWTKKPCSNGLVVAENAEKKVVCGSIYYKSDSECVCPEKEGCFVTTDENSVNWDKNYKVSESKSNGCVYYAACDSLTTDCEGEYSPTYGANKYTEQECIDAGTEPEGDVVVPAGVCGGPYYEGCKSVKQ